MHAVEVAAKAGKGLHVDDASPPPQLLSLCGKPKTANQPRADVGTGGGCASIKTDAVQQQTGQLKSCILSASLSRQIDPRDTHPARRSFRQS